MINLKTESTANRSSAYRAVLGERAGHDSSRFVLEVKLETFVPSMTAIADSTVLSALVGILPLLVFFALLGVFKLETHWCAVGALHRCYDLSGCWVRYCRWEWWGAPPSKAWRLVLPLSFTS